MTMRLKILIWNSVQDKPIESVSRKGQQVYIAIDGYGGDKGVAVDIFSNSDIHRLYISYWCGKIVLHINLSQISMAIIHCIKMVI